MVHEVFKALINKMRLEQNEETENENKEREAGLGGLINLLAKIDMNWANESLFLC